MKYYLRDEVIIHNQPDDLWIIINGVIFDLTLLIKDRLDTMNDNLRYLIAMGGKDLSQYFTAKGKPRLTVSVNSGNSVALFGPAIEYACSHFAKTPGLYWWEDPLYMIGKITKKNRKIRIINTLTQKDQAMVVCEEDTIHQIMEKYRERYNSHAGSYTWKKDSKNELVSGYLNLNGTLTENGLFAEKDHIGISPSLWLYYNDDITLA